MKKTTRRDFIFKCSFACLGCSTILPIAKTIANDNFNMVNEDPEKLDPKLLNYCGYTCPKDCKVYVASVKNDVELKKDAYKLWDIEKRYGIKFNADSFYCFQCKNTAEPQGIIQENCSVRACAIDKGYECCIECQDLKQCDKALWKKFPEFHQSIIKMQKEYQQKNTA